MMNEGFRLSQKILIGVIFALFVFSSGFAGFFLLSMRKVSVFRNLAGHYSLEHSSGWWVSVYEPEPDLGRLARDQISSQDTLALPSSGNVKDFAKRSIIVIVSYIDHDLLEKDNGVQAWSQPFAGGHYEKSKVQLSDDRLQGTAYSWKGTCGGQDCADETVFVEIIGRHGSWMLSFEGMGAGPSDHRIQSVISSFKEM